MIRKYGQLPLPIKASIWFIVCGILQRGISFLTVPIFTRLLNPEEFGTYNLFLTWQSLLTIFASLNLASGVYLRGLVKYEGDKSFTLSMQRLFNLCFIATFIIYFIFRSFLNKYIGLPSFYVCILFADMFLQVSVHFWSARRRVKYRYKELVILTLINAILQPAVGIFAVLNYDDKVLVRLLSILVVDIITYGYIGLKMWSLNDLAVSTKYWKYALTYNLPLIPHYLSQQILSQSDRVMIDYLGSKEMVGIYSLGYSVGMVLLFLNQSLQNVYTPWVYQKIKQARYGDIAKVSYLLLIMIALLDVFVIVVTPEIVKILAPASYYDAMWVIPPVAMSVYFMFLYGLFSNYEFYYEKTRLIMIASLIVAILNIFLNYLFIPIYGYVVAAYTTLLCYVIYCITHYSFMRIVIRKNQNSFQNVYDIRIIIGISLVFVLFGLFIMAFFKNSIIRYIVVFIFFTIIFTYRNKIVKIMSLLRKT